MENAPLTNKGLDIGMVLEQRQMMAKFNLFIFGHLLGRVGKNNSPENNVQVVTPE